MSFQTGLSGLNSASRNLDVIGNNVANAGVSGFKSSRVQFADVFAASLNGGGTGPVGIGSKVSTVTQDFTQGTISVTNNPLDLAISGSVFFRMEQNGLVTYSRSGEFRLDNAGYIVNSLGYNLSGYAADATGAVVRTAPAPLQISNADIPPTATTGFEAVFNLDSRSTAITAPFSPSNPATYTSTTAGTVYDSLGNPHEIRLFFALTSTPRTWAVYGTVDGASTPNITGLPATIAFGTNGQLSTAMPVTGVSIPVAGGAASPLTVSFDFSGATSFGAEFGVTELNQDGFTSGRIAGFTFGSDGLITGRYTNGQTRTIGQVALTSFINPQGLRQLGEGQYAETSASGLAIVGTPESGTLGSLQSGALEQSNVDLTEALVELITAQRNYQANAQTIKTLDSVLQTLVNLR
jgi:flagellar hook protein FlgE